jgi:4-carboxymuconolactone decarboxylase
MESPDARSQQMTRIQPIAGKADVPAEYESVVDSVLQVFGRVQGPYSVLLHSPALAERVLNLGNYLRGDSIVEPRDRSLAILVAAREREGAYVWSAQAGAARRAGVREEAIDLIRAKAAPDQFASDEQDIVAYAQQLMQTNRVSQAAFDTLLQRHGEQWLVELTAAFCYYSFLSGVVSAFEVPAPPDGDPLTK